MTLLEVLVSIAIMLLLTAILVPSLSAYMMLEQRAAARKITLLYELLHDEAVLRNETYRIVYDLDGGRWHVEKASAAAAVIYDSPEAREEHEKRLKEELGDLDPEQAAARRDELANFQTVTGGEAWAQTFSLPANTRFGSVYTPQYGEPVTPSGEGPKGRKRRSSRGRDDEGAGPPIVFSYIFPNGFVEHTVVQLVDRDDPESGFTIAVDPMSGRVRMVAELESHEDAFRWVPEEGPELQL
jgi:type II secretory pathway pseudopilin PulG